MSLVAKEKTTTQSDYLEIILRELKDLKEQVADKKSSSSKSKKKEKE